MNYENLKWTYIVDDKPCGPVAFQELLSLEGQKVITSNTYVWAEGVAEWLPFGELIDLVKSGSNSEQTSGGCITREVALDFVDKCREQGCGAIDGELIWGTSIDHSAALVLAQYEDVLRLKGLIEIDDLTAEALSSYDGECLALDRLENVTDIGFEILSRSCSAQLQLSGKVLMSPSRATHLAQNYEGILILRCDGLKISNDIIEGLWGFKGEALALDDYTLFDDESLTYLAGLKVEYLEIPGKVFEDEDHQFDGELADRFEDSFVGEVSLRGEGYEEDDEKLSIEMIKIDEGNPSDEFIVKVDFYYSDITYAGFMILDRETISVLNRELDSDREVYAPNTPDNWCEEFEISRLQGAFTIHSEKAPDVEAMRSLFGERIGNVELITMILDMVENDELDEESDDDDYSDDND